MKRPYVKEPVRARIVAMLKRAYTYGEVADAFGVGAATVNRIWRRYRETGLTTLRPRGGGNPPAIAKCQNKELESFVTDRPTASYAELAIEWSKKTGKKISRATMVRHVLRLGFTRKKLSKKACEKLTKSNRAKRAAYKYRLRAIDPEKLVFLDEAGFQSGLTPTYGRSKRGTPAVLWTPAKRTANFTQVGAIRLTGPVVMRGSTKAMNKGRFLQFLRRDLLPRVKVRDVIVMDNLAAHRQSTVRKIARQWGVRVDYLPPYCPQLNPMKQVWAWMKQRLRYRMHRVTQWFRYAVSGAWRKAAMLCYQKLFANCGYMSSSHAI